MAATPLPNFSPAPALGTTRSGSPRNVTPMMPTGIPPRTCTVYGSKACFPLSNRTFAPR